MRAPPFDVVDGSSNVRAQLFDAAGLAQGDGFTIAAAEGGSQSRPAVAASSQRIGEFIVAWQEKEEEEESDVGADPCGDHRYPCIDSCLGDLSTHELSTRPAPPKTGIRVRH